MSIVRTKHEQVWQKRIDAIGKASKDVAIIVPGSFRKGLSASEELSIRLLNKHLGDFDRFFVVPKGSGGEIPGLRTFEVSRKYFGSVYRHCMMLEDPAFYQLFADYEFILIYHTDALVFRNELEDWLNKPIDFVGPPWMVSEQTPWVKERGVGNGGFSLLRVSAALRTLFERYKEMPTYWATSSIGSGVIGLNGLLRKVGGETFLAGWPVLKRFRKYEREIIRNDIFWGKVAQTFNPDFRVASFEEGLQWGFEAEPRTCLELNGGELPFGCHAWEKYDKAFWEEQLSSLGEPVSG